MGKSKSEIQKAYRERQKAKGPSFLEKERLRQRNYYKPVAELTEKKRRERNFKNKMRNRLSRLRKKERNQGNQQRIETSGYESIEPSSEASVPEQGQVPRKEPEQEKLRLIVRLPITKQTNKAKGLAKQRKRKMTDANRKILALKSDNMKLRKTLKIRNRKIQRLQKKNKDQHRDVTLTPGKQTAIEVNALNLTPKRHSYVRKRLMLLNTMTAEIKETRRHMTSKKSRSLAKILSGRIAKKYRCINNLNNATGLSRKSLSNIIDKDIVTVTKLKIDSLSKKIEQSVLEFFNRDDNSRAQPGKSDAKKVGTHEKKQTRVLTDYMKNLYDKYMSENPDIKISLSTFQRLRPKYILLTAFISRNTCQCIHHQNMALKVQAIRKAGIKIGSNPEHLIAQRGELRQVLTTLPEKVTFKIWKKVEIEPGKSRMKIVDHECDAETFTSELERQLQLFSEHVTRVQEQYRQIRLIKEKLPDDEMILQMDFAENYSCRSLDEIQTAYWNQSMVTLHPIVAYYKEAGKLKHQSFVVVSDELSHSAGTVCAFLDQVMPFLKAMKPELKKIHYWTDSPSSQYRNRYIFYMIANHKSTYNIDVVWNYFEAGHGKGPCDGLGGTVKRMADEASKQGHVTIQDASEFYKWAVNSSMTGVKFIYVSKAETKERQLSIYKVKAKPFKGTMRFHAIGMTNDKHILMAKEMSCYCEICLGGSYCDAWKRQTFNYEVETVEPSEESHPNIDHSEKLETENETSDASNNPCVKVSNKEEENDKGDETPNPTIGSFVAAIYEHEWYIGQIVGIDDEDDEIDINFMSRAKMLYKWPTVADRIWTDRRNILCEVTPPAASGRSQRLFKLSPEDQEKIKIAFERFIPLNNS